MQPRKTRYARSTSLVVASGARLLRDLYRSSRFGRSADFGLSGSRASRFQATSAHLGMLKAKLAKLKRELLMPTAGGGGGAGLGFDVAKVEFELRSPSLYNRWNDGLFLSYFRPAWLVLVSSASLPSANLLS